MDEKIVNIYLDNAEGFNPELGPPAIQYLIGKINEVKVEGLEIKVLDPFQRSAKLVPEEDTAPAWEVANPTIFKRNNADMDISPIMVATLNIEDAGVASEIGYFHRTGTIIGFRDSYKPGENKGTPYNLQAHGYIVKSGGTIVTNSNDLQAELRKHLNALSK